MAGITRKISKVETARHADFDEQLWPINCAIIILAGFVAGIVIATSDFHDPHIIYNGWARLISVALMVGLAFLGVWYLQGKMRRRLQLCILVSLLLHLWMVTELHNRYLALLAAEQEKRAQLIEDDQQTIVPDYHWEQIERPRDRQTFEEPIETEVPRPTDPEALQREAEEPETPPTPEPPDEPEIPQRQQPNPAVTRRAELSAPRRAERAAGAQISRQEWKHVAAADEPIPEPELQTEPRPAIAVPNPNIAPRQRQESQVRIEQRQTFEEISSAQAERVEVRLSRRASGSVPLPDRPTTPRPSRQITRPAEIAQTQAATPRPAEVTRRTPQLEQPLATTRMAARQQAESPQILRPSVAPTPLPTTPNALAHVSSRRERSERQPQPSRARRPVLQRRSADVAVADLAARPQPDTTAAATRPNVSAEPTLARVPRRRNASAVTSPTAVTQRAANVPVRPAPNAVAQPSTRREVQATEPVSTTPLSRPVRVTRAQDAPQTAAARIEPAAVTAEATASAQPSLPAARPATSAVSRAATRAPRAVAQQTPGRELPALTRSTQLPAALAARRTSAAQQAPPGTQAAPARPMSLARQTPGANLPSTTIAAAAPAEATAAAAGGTPASRIAQAPASAVLRREAAAPPAGRTAAAAGSVPLAIGSGQIVARIGQARSVGNSRPSAAANAQVPRLARAAAPAGTMAASGVPNVPQAPAGAVASTAKGPTVPTSNIQASSARRGGTTRSIAQQSDAGSGPAGASGTPGPVSVTTSRRVTRVVSVASAVTGGGTPRPMRTTGGAPSPSATAQASQVVASAAPAGGKAEQALPSPGQLSGARQEVSGLPGSIQSQPMAGAAASLSPQGEPLARAVARRQAASGPSPGAEDLAASRSVTLKRSRSGVELPAAAVAVDNAPQVGTGGVSVASGSLPSSLQAGPSATVRRAAADLSQGPDTAAAGSAESALGAATAVAMAGQVRSGGDATPALADSVAMPRAGRSTAVGPAMATAGPLQEQVAAEAPAGVPTGQTGSSAPPVAGTPSSAVARQTGGAAAAQPAEQEGMLAGPDGAAVVAAQSGRLRRDDSAVAGVTASGAVAGPSRTVGTLHASGQSAAAAELAPAGPASGGFDAAMEVSLQTSLSGPPQESGGLPGARVEQLSVETAEQFGPTSSTPGSVAGERRVPQGDQLGPSLAAEVGRGPVRTTDAPGLPRGVAEALDEQPIAAAAAAEPGEAVEVARGAGAGEPRRREGGLPVQIVAMAGPGGLSYDPSPEVGLPSRRARRESDYVHTVARRFPIERSGGELAVDGRVREQPAQAFSQRDIGRRAQAAETRGGNAGTEWAVELGLDFFARLQFPDGHWSLHELPPGVDFEDAGLGQMQSDTAATGLALLSYFGAGYTHLDDKHRAVINRGVDWLVRNQKPDGDLFPHGSQYAKFYSHAIAAIALCEAYGMTQDPQLREPARKAIQFLVNTQHEKQGGWRYTVDRKTGRSSETDTSVTGWGLMALKSAQMAGIDVPGESLDKIDGWLDSAAAREGAGKYVYNPYAGAQQSHGRKASLVMTAEAMLMRMYLGHENDEPRLVEAAEYLTENLPAVGTRQRPLRNCYYWYYATQAMFQMGGDHWTAWNERLRPLVQSSQNIRGPLAGSWDPQGPVPDRWGHAGGRVYVTALNVLMLEVYYRHLPLFQELRR